MNNYPHPKPDVLSVAPNGASIVFVLEGRFVFGIA